jgi:UDP-glucose 4-epimerase
MSGALRIALTGCNAVIGKKCLENLHLFDGLERVVVFDIQPPAIQDKRILYYQVDLAQPGVEQEMASVLKDEGVEAFLHAAFFWNTTMDSEWAHEVESVGTDRVLAYVIEAKVKRFVLTSSATVYGITHRNATPLAESAPLVATKTLPPWRDKVEADMKVQKFAEENKGITVTIIRSAILLHRSIDRFLSRTLASRFIPVFMGFDPIFQFVHPDDLILFYVKALSEDHGGVFNVAPDDVIALSDFIKLGKKMAIPLPHVPFSSLYRILWASGIGEVHPAFLNFLRFSLVVDGRKAQKEFGISPRSTLDTVREFLGVS